MQNWNWWKTVLKSIKENIQSANEERLYVYTPAGLVGGLLGKDPTYVPYYPGDADLGLEMVAPEGGTTHLEVFHLFRLQEERQRLKQQLFLEGIKELWS